MRWVQQRSGEPSLLSWLGQGRIGNPGKVTRNPYHRGRYHWEEELCYCQSLRIGFPWTTSGSRVNPNPKQARLDCHAFRHPVFPVHFNDVGNDEGVAKKAKPF